MLNAAADLAARLEFDGFAVAPAPAFTGLAGAEAWRELASDWEHLQVDRYMADGGLYRRRRFGRFYWVPATDTLARLPHALVHQHRDINRFVGGIHRDFAPLRDETWRNPWLLAAIRADFRVFAPPPGSLHDPWEVWVHQIRIVSNGPSVRPAPEGVHHDGHDFIAMHLVGKENVAGGRSRIFDNEGRPLHDCMLERPHDTIYCDDHRVMHGVDPIEPARAALPAWRDLLIIDYDHRPGLAAPR